MPPGFLCEDSAARQRGRNPNTAKLTEGKNEPESFLWPRAQHPVRSPSMPQTGTKNSGTYESFLNAAYKVQFKPQCAMSSRTFDTRITAIQHKVSTLSSLSEERVAECDWVQAAAWVQPAPMSRRSLRRKSQLCNWHFLSSKDQCGPSHRQDKPMGDLIRPDRQMCLKFVVGHTEHTMKLLLCRRPISSNDVQPKCMLVVTKLGYPISVAVRHFSTLSQGQTWSLSRTRAQKYAPGTSIACTAPSQNHLLKSIEQPCFKRLGMPSALPCANLGMVRKKQANGALNLLAWRQHLC
eukprot:5245112-Amphidinium_carterae.2